MIKAVIIDDELNCINSLKTDLARHCGNVQVCGSYTSAKEGIIAIRKYNPDLVFLDIEMPLINGFEMLEMLDPFDFFIIFTTAYDKFAAKAFRLSAVDYLLKPVDPEDLKIAVNRTEEKMLSASKNLNIQNLLQNIRQPIQQQKIALPNRDGYEFVSISSILYCNAEGAYTRIFLSDKRVLLVSKSLGDIEELLPSDIFVRIHHSHIVHLTAIVQYVRTDGGYVVMSTNEKLMVSKTRKEVLLEKLGLK
jgi:two-component system LytT family response regulator